MVARSPALPTPSAAAVVGCVARPRQFASPPSRAMRVSAPLPPIAPAPAKAARAEAAHPPSGRNAYATPTAAEVRSATSPPWLATPDRRSATIRANAAAGVAARVVLACASAGVERRRVCTAVRGRPMAARPSSPAAPPLVGRVQTVPPRGLPAARTPRAAAPPARRAPAAATAARIRGRCLAPPAPIAAPPRSATLGCAIRPRSRTAMAA